MTIPEQDVMKTPHTQAQLAEADTRAFELLKQAEAVLVDRLKGSSDDRSYRERYDALDSVRKAMQRIHPEALVEKIKLSNEDAEGWRKDSRLERHESYGVLSVSRPSGSRRLVGSMIDSLPTYVELIVKRAYREIDSKSFVEHFYHEGPILLRVAMSTTQWADLITGMNGVEIPCTLDTLLGARMDPVPDEVKTPLDQVAHDTRNEMIRGKDEVEEAFLKKVLKLETQIKDSKLSKKAASDLLKTLGSIRDSVSVPRATASWAAQRVAEVTEATVAQGRMEMAAAVETLIRRSGLKAIEGRLAEHVSLQLTEGSSSDD